MRSVWSLLVLVVCATTPHPTYAQTAEDTVAFLLYGLHDGAREFKLSVDLGSGSLQMRKSEVGVWKRDENGVFSMRPKQNREGTLFRVVVRRLGNCEFTVLVSSWSDNPDYDDENLVTLDFSKVLAIVYRAQQKDVGLREFAGPLRITVAGKNAICQELRFDASSKPPTRTECFSDGQHLFPTALPFVGLTRTTERQTAAVSLFRQKFCPKAGS